MNSFVIITGLSGSGKGTFLRALEDRGYFCVDNLPVGLLAKFYELTLKSDEDVTKVAMVIDIREGESLRQLPAVCDELRKQEGLKVSLWFLEASEAALARRFSETRRPHPLNPDRPVSESIAQERELLAPIREIADHILDTSALTIHELRKHAHSVFGEQEARLLVLLVSFGFKFGVPSVSDLVFDVRFLPNPHFVPHLKALSGEDSAVIEFMNEKPETGEFVSRLEGFLDFLIPQYEKEGKSYVTVSIGCTGGRHRSVFITNEVAKHFESMGYRVRVTHRDSAKV
ncbi:MAG TPA: RNase adapter RapZ [Terriglobia bacterium]|nr:RNase adapter RapZ [Terriglobia bacterium]